MGLSERFSVLCFRRFFHLFAVGLGRIEPRKIFFLWIDTTKIDLIIVPALAILGFVGLLAFVIERAALFLLGLSMLATLWLSWIVVAKATLIVYMTSYSLCFNFYGLSTPYLDSQSSLF